MSEGGAVTGAVGKALDVPINVVGNSVDGFLESADAVKDSAFDVAESVEDLSEAFISETRELSVKLQANMRRIKDALVSIAAPLDPT